MRESARCSGAEVHNVVVAWRDVLCSPEQCRPTRLRVASSARRVAETRRAGCKELSFLERTIELMIDLLDQLPTRRFFRPLLVDKHLTVRDRDSKAARWH